MTFDRTISDQPSGKGASSLGPDLGIPGGVRIGALPVSRRRGYPVLRDGMSSEEFIHLVEGWVGIYRTLDAGERRLIRVVLRGEYAGLTLTPQVARDFSAEALTDVKVSYGLNNAVLKHASYDSHFALKICKLMHLYERECLNALIMLTSLSAKERLAHLFASLGMRLTGNSIRKGMVIDVPLTQQMLADATSLSAVHVNRTLRELREERILAHGNGKLTIMSPSRLLKLSQLDR